MMAACRLWVPAVGTAGGMMLAFPTGSFVCTTRIYDCQGLHTILQTTEP